MAKPLLSLTGTSLTFGGDALLQGADLEIKESAKIALVGRNGSGKSTLLKIAAGFVEADSGERFVHPRTTIAYLTQEPAFKDYKTAREYIEANPVLSDGIGAYRIDQLAEELGFSPALELANASGGEARRIAIANTLISDADILLLDEPTNHLDLPTIEWLEQYLRKSKSALVTISHDRRFLEQVTDNCVWIDRGLTRRLSQGFKHFETWRDKTLEEEKLADHKLDRKIVAEEDWVRYGVTARRKRNVRRLGELHELRKRVREKIKPAGEIKFAMAQSDASGKRVIVADEISKSYDMRKIVDGFSIEINRGDRIGVVGANGAGKSTLINLLTGALKPDTGEIKHGANIELISLDQKRASLDPNTRLVDAITDGRGDFVTIGDKRRHVSTYLQDFLFKPEQWRTPVSSLSGGERGRLALAIALSKPSNLLALDEPTNDLDLETLDLLEEILFSYAGTLLLISHDRNFIDRTATSILAQDLENPARWIQFPGGYDDMIAQRGDKKTGKPKQSDASAPSNTARSPEKQAAKAAKPQSKKLSYKEKYALETLPGKIETLAAEAAELESTLAQTGAWERDPERYDASARRLSAVKSELAEAEDQWLELELKHESLSAD